MKNIHILPTDKPSRYVTNYMEQTMQWQNLFITSDKEIKEGDWALDLCEDLGLKNQPFKVDKATLKFANQECEKIILTTDQDLIKDGIQDIDDEFLEWFVKNPSCEEVEVVGDDCYYEIIIPKEEPKQETLEEAAVSRLFAIMEDEYNIVKLFWKKEDADRELEVYKRDHPDALLFVEEVDVY